MKNFTLIMSLLAAISFTANAQLTFVTQSTPTSNALLSINFADTSTGYASGNYGTMLKTSNGGKTWARLIVPTSVNLWDVKPIPGSAGQKVIAVGDNNTVIKSVDGGASWTQQTIPFAAGSFVFGIQCLDSFNYVACGGDFSTNSGAILRTSNGGATWTAYPVANTLFLDKIFMVNSSLAFTVGTGTTGSSGSIHKTMDGQTFTAQHTSTNIITNLWCKNANEIVAIGLGGQLWRSTDGGNNWTDASYNTTDLYGVAFRDANRGFACGGGSGALILSTKDGGSVWTPENYAGNGALQALCIVDTKLFVAGDGGKILKADLSQSSNGIDRQEPATVEVQVYPNPATEKIRVVVEKHSGDIILQLFDHLGRLVAEKTGNSKSFEIDAPAQKGDYTYIIRSEGMQQATGKISIR